MTRFSTAGASAYLYETYGLRAKPKTMANWRSEGRGPRYTRAANGQVVYEQPDLDDYGREQLRAGPVSSTTEEKNRGVSLPPGGPAARAMLVASGAANTKQQRNARGRLSVDGSESTAPAT
jgi:hypothetical protein